MSVPVREQDSVQVSRLTLAQKASLTSGGSTWHTQALPEAGVPAARIADGPHGVRKYPDAGADPLDFDGSEPATCFPPGAGLASSWNPDLVARVGTAIGAEAAAAGVALVLGPGLNIKRSPLCGRNFEYFAEDPLLAGRLAAAFVRGVQSRGVGACLKHFAVNNQETDRMRVSAEVDERALREIYLPAFEHAVRTARPSTVMTAYNRINGRYASECGWLLTGVLRGEWGFDGLVISDWGGIDDRVAALAAGTDLAMPPPTGADDGVRAAVAAGLLDESTVDAAAARVLALVRRTAAGLASAEPVDPDAHHALARAAAAESAVLLRNEGGLLPLDPAGTGLLAVLGEFARTPRLQGGGSSRVVPTRTDTALDALRALAPGRAVEFAPGFRLDGVPDRRLADDAVALAARARTVVVFLGLPEHAESEGFDRTDLDLPADQLALLAEVAAVNDRVVVVLSNGGAVAVSPWQDSVAAVLECWLLGQAGGSATADLLFGVANPSGKLAETLPLLLADTPAYPTFPGGDGTSRYGEGIYVGYRHHDTVRGAVAHPFGHGLSYTTFGYRDLLVTADPAEPGAVTATFTVSNTGAVPGAEVAQVYLHPLAPAVDRPEQELAGFDKVRLAPGESAAVTVRLPRRAFARWSPRAGGWVVDRGGYQVRVGASSRDVRLRATVHQDGDPAAPLTARSTLGEWLAHPVGGPLLRASGYLAMLGFPGDELVPMAAATPLARLEAFLSGTVTAADLDRLVAAARDVENGGPAPTP